MVQILLILKVLLAKESEVEDLFCGAPPGCEPSLVFRNNLFSLGFDPVQGDLQHDFTGMTDEANSSVILAELLAALFRECNDQRLSPWVGHSPVFEILVQIFVKTSIMVSPPA